MVPLDLPLLQMMMMVLVPVCQKLVVMPSALQLDLLHVYDPLLEMLAYVTLTCDRQILNLFASLLVVAWQHEVLVTPLLMNLNLISVPCDQLVSVL